MLLGKLYNFYILSLNNYTNFSVMEVDKEKGGNRICYICRKWGYIAKNCWERHKERVVEMLHELAKESGG